VTTFDDYPVAVIGAGIAGLASAAAAARAGARVVVIERDEFALSAARRRGVPQSNQLHNLLARGQRHLESLVPGFRAAVLETGGNESRVGPDTHIWDFGAELPHRDTGVRIMSAWRPTFEQIARQALDELPNVLMLAGTSAVHIDVREGAVAGVHVKSRSGAQVVEARLVVDASGASALGERWFGGGMPVERVVLDRWYASTTFPGRHGAGFAMCFPSDSTGPGALASPAGHNRWHVSVSGTGRHQVPRDSSGVLAHLATLEDRWISRLLLDREGTEPVSVFHRPEAVRRHYHSRRAVPDGFIAIGDSSVTLSPLAGLGLSVAAWQADILRDVLTDSLARRLSSGTITTEFDRRACEVADQAWTVSNLRDRPLVTDLVENHGVSHPEARRVVNHLIRIDPAAHRLDTEMWHLLTPIARTTMPKSVAQALAVWRDTRGS
jgi:2-polyprenyl-6-methoxyphenol hydroxylase-like FAD-dependent oxidoreductase